jgi:XRE family transcriptional regulator, fatty acid utilization regulator
MIDIEDDYKAVGEALRVLRRRAGLTQAQAADQVGVRNTYISQVERGSKGVSVRTMLKLLRVYSADLQALADEVRRGRGD